MRQTWGILIFLIYYHFVLTFVVKSEYVFEIRSSGGNNNMSNKRSGENPEDTSGSESGVILRIKEISLLSELLVPYRFSP